jgi:DNA mismatch endonuclease, patch repair protein
MSRIKGENTMPERIVRSALHALGYRFRLHSRNLPGKPDIVLPKHRAVVFVHGCFWHHHLGCPFAYVPRTREVFWKTKFADNALRDHKVSEEIEKRGWRVIVIWECELADVERLREKLLAVLATRVDGES